MTNKLYKFEIDAPATADKVKSLLLGLDKSKGNMFRIERAWVAMPNMDAIAAGDTQGFQISTLSQNENSALLAIDSEYEVFTWFREIALAEAALVNNEESIRKYFEIPGIEGTLLECNKKNYLNAICTGQDAADVATKVKILGQYVSTNIDDWNYNAL